MIGSILYFTASLDAKEITLNDDIDKVYQAIVRIEVVSESGSGGRMMKSRSTGSGGDCWRLASSDREKS